MTSKMNMIYDALSGMEETLLRPVPFAALDKRKANLLAMIGQLKSGIEDSARPLRILLAGGTGVGKSTLLNALAGAEIAETGEKRPCTRGHVVYIHESDADAWVESIDNVRVVRHERSELRHKLIIDAPDPDSAVPENRRIFEKALELADLVMVVTSQEKYASEAVESLLRQYRTGRRFVFVLNKSDQDPAVEILDDIRGMMDRNGFGDAPMFRISALSALMNPVRAAVDSAGETRPGTGEKPEGETGADGRLSADFCALEYTIGEAITVVRVTELMQANLIERFGLLVDSIMDALPGSLDALATEWSKRWKESMQPFLWELRSVIMQRIIPEEKLKPLVMERKTMGRGGIFGFFARLMYAFRRLLSSRNFFQGGGHEREMELECMNASDCLRLSSVNTRMRMTWLSAARSLGLNPEVSGVDWGRTWNPAADKNEYSQSFCRSSLSLFLDEEILPSAEEPGSERASREQPWMTVRPPEQIAATLQGSVLEQIRSTLTNHVKPVNAFGRCLLNLPALAWIGYMGWKIAEPVLRFEEPRVESAPGAFLVLIAILAVQWAAFDRILEWWAKRFTYTIQSIVVSRVMDEVSGAVAVGPDRVEREIRRFMERLDLLEHSRASVAADTGYRNRPLRPFPNSE